MQCHCQFFKVRIYFAVVSVVSIFVDKFCWHGFCANMTKTLRENLKKKKKKKSKKNLEDQPTAA